LPIWKGISGPVSEPKNKDLFSVAPDTLSHSLEEPLASPVEAKVEKVMVMLAPQQVHALDRICLEIRQTTGMKFKRSMLIRALIDGFLEAPINFNEAKSYEEVTQKIIHSFIRIP
jgi:hypothetical protein